MLCAVDSWIECCTDFRTKFCHDVVITFYGGCVAFCCLSAAAASRLFFLVRCLPSLSTDSLVPTDAPVK